MTGRALFVLGAGGLGREVAQLALEFDVERHWDFRGFIGSPEEVGRTLSLGPVVGTDEWLLGAAIEADLLLGIGSPALRDRIAGRFLNSAQRFRFPNVIHPTARVDPRFTEFGSGNAVTAGCTFTLDIRVGDFNYFNLHTTIGHDVVIGSDCVLNPAVNVSGQARIGDRVLVGTGAQILEGRSIGDDATIGAGAVVTKDVAAGTTVVGVPARPLGQ